MEILFWKRPVLILKRTVLFLDMLMNRQEGLNGGNARRAFGLV